MKIALIGYGKMGKEIEKVLHWVPFLLPNILLTSKVIWE